MTVIGYRGRESNAVAVSTGRDAQATNTNPNATQRFRANSLGNSFAVIKAEYQARRATHAKPSAFSSFRVRPASAYNCRCSGFSKSLRIHEALGWLQFLVFPQRQFLQGRRAVSSEVNRKFVVRQETTVFVFGHISSPPSHSRSGKDKLV